MSFKFSAAHSSRIKKASKAPSFNRSASAGSPYSSLPRRKPIQRSSSKPEGKKDEDEDFFEDRLDDFGLVKALATDLTLRDVAQAIQYIWDKMWSVMPQQAGMNSTRIAEVLNFRKPLPPIVTVAHVQALLNSPTAVEREIAELIKGGVIRKVVVGGRGSIGEALVMTKDLEEMIEKSDLERVVKDNFVALLRLNFTALNLPRSALSEAEAKALMHAGFLTASLPGGGSSSTTDTFTRPGDGSRGTMTSLHSISKAASGSMAAVGGEGAVHNAGGSGGGVQVAGSQLYSLALPATGAFLKLLANARAHLLSLLTKSKYREIPEALLQQRWNGGVAADDGGSLARRNRGEFAGVLAGRTRKWKQFYGLEYTWVLEECVGAGLMEVFDSGTGGRGVRAL